MSKTDSFSGTDAALGSATPCLTPLCQAADPALHPIRAKATPINVRHLLICFIFGYVTVEPKLPGHPQHGLVLADISHVTSKSISIIPKLHRRCNVFLRWPPTAWSLVIWWSSEAHLAIFVAIQTHLFRCFCRVVDPLGLRRNGSSSQVINQGQDFLEQASRHSNLGQLESDIAAMANDLGSDLHQLLP